MSSAWKLKRLKKRISRSLSTDTMQAKGFHDWLNNVESPDDLRLAPDPGWLVHVAYWSGVKAKNLFVAATSAVSWLRAQAEVDLPITNDEWKDIQKVADIGADPFLPLDNLLSGIAYFMYEIDNDSDDRSLKRPGSRELHTATLFLMHSAMQCRDGRPEALAEALGRSMALFGLSHQKYKSGLTDRFRKELGY